MALIGFTTLVVVCWLINYFHDLQPPEPVNLVIGDRGPIDLRFAHEMQPTSVENRWKIEPHVVGRFVWEGQLLRFWPVSTLEAGAVYTVSLQPGSKSLDGRLIKPLPSYTFKVRRPRVIFLSPPTVGSEVWTVTADGSNKVKLTQTENHVYDFSPSYDGEWIVYSVLNAQNGADLWRIRRDGHETQLLVNCGFDSCIHPAVSPDGLRIAYSRVHGTTPADMSMATAGIWILELGNGQISPLNQDLLSAGVEPSWSPDGNHLAFFNPAVKMINVVDPQGQQQLQLNSQSGEIGGWSPDSRYLFFTNLEQRGTLPAGVGFKVDIATKTVERLFGAPGNVLDITALAPMPGKNWVAVGTRYPMGSRATRIQLLSLDGASQRDITNDPLYTYGAFSWSPDSSSLVYQQLKVGTSVANPEIWIWDATTGSRQKAAADAALPAWLP